MGLFGRKKKEDVEGASTVCFVLLEGDAALTTDQLGTGARAEFGDQARVEDGTESDGDLSVFTIEDGTDRRRFVTHIPVPVPDGEAEHSADGNIFWDGGRDAVAAHGSHCIVAAFVDDGDALDACLEATRAARAVLDAFGSRAIGVYWGSGSTALSADAFREMSAEASRDEPPLYAWMRFQPVVDDGKWGLYTVGMEQLGHMEIEVPPCETDPNETMGFITNLALYLITEGAEIGDGDTVGGSADEVIKVRHRKSMVDREGTVLVVGVQ